MNYPESWRFTPIEKGYKRPLGGGWQKKPMNWDIAFKIYQSSQGAFCPVGVVGGDRNRYQKTTFSLQQGRAVGAIGLMCGEQSGGLLLLDHDGESCEGLLNGWGEVPLTWKVSSGKPGHFQLVFTVPERYWAAVTTRKYRTGALDADGKHEQIELRWNGCQSVVFGEHPETGNQYQWTDTDLDIAEAPLWLIGKMIAPIAGQEFESRKDWSASDWASEYLEAIDPSLLDFYSWRDCLFGASAAGLSESEVRQWSARSPKHTDTGFGDVWRYIKNNKGRNIDIGTLGWLAKEHGWQPAPKPPQQSKSSPAKQSSTQQPDGKQSKAVLETPDFNQTLDQVDLLEECITSRSELAWQVQNFAYEGGLTSRGFSGSKLLELARARKDESEAVQLIDAIDILESQEKPQFLVAGLLLKGTVGATAGFGGSGKTVLFYDIAKHVAMGTPWSGYRVEKGRVLIVQTDEPKPNISQKLRIQGWRDVERGMVDFITKWRFTQFRELERKVREGGYSLVIIDSWTAAHAGTGVDLTKSNAGDNAYLLRDLAEDTNCCIEVLHHLNKMGELRDSTSLKDNVSEVRLFKAVPDNKLPADHRIMSIEKSRSDLTGEYLLAQNPRDYSWRHLGVVGAEDDLRGESFINQAHEFMKQHPEKRFSAWDMAREFSVTPEKAEIDLARLSRWGVTETDWTVSSRPGEAERGFMSYYYPPDVEEQPTQDEPQETVSEALPEVTQQPEAMPTPDVQLTETIDEEEAARLARIEEEDRIIQDLYEKCKNAHTYEQFKALGDGIDPVLKKVVWDMLPEDVRTRVNKLKAEYALTKGVA